LIHLVYAHPHHSRSVAQRALLESVKDLPELRVHSLYDRYPDFSIDVAAEQALLAEARLVIWQHPLYWYTTPALLKHWFESVLLHGWAYGTGGTTLAGKHCLWVTSTGAPWEEYRPEGMHQHTFESFVPVVKQTAQFCGMVWNEPFVVHGAHRIGADVMKQHGASYRARLEQWVKAHG
jgi:glutathione-regulated potassium-efflux system ancillary protein KefF